MYRLGHRAPPPPGGPPTAAGARLLDHRRRHPGQHKERGLPLSGIICDFFRWPEPGDRRFEESEWPDPAAMVEQLADLEVNVAVSMWQTVEPGSDTYHELRASGHLVRDAEGGLLTFACPTRESDEAPTLPMAYCNALRGTRRAVAAAERQLRSLSVECF
ncbi:TIM-barrel domain-containing protein [Streptomyces sp. NPDC012510]|uniref:TIM-barrel domain-containing protein n=1 Tax=Streptomyces sp. NPDC012510 TaxID=3364838 RepID=UPI0036EE4C14